MTARALDAMHVPYRVVVEEQEHAEYAKVIDKSKLLVLDKSYQRDYDAYCALKPGSSKGSGPARNFIWDHALSEGAQWAWTIDDNIGGFLHWNRNQKVWVGDGTVLRCMEAFGERFSNVAMLGPAYEFFVFRRDKRPPFTLNTRIYSCNLIRLSAPFRWRGRYNEDTDLSLRMLKAGWVTVLFNAFLQKKMTAGKRMKGGNTDEVYSDGTLAKSRMLAALHPDVARVSWKFNRWHHTVDYSGFKQRPILDPDVMVDKDKDWGMEVICVPKGVTYATDWRPHVELPSGKMKGKGGKGKSKGGKRQEGGK